jgi:hypothetical protein
MCEQLIGFVVHNRQTKQININKEVHDNQARKYNLYSRFSAKDQELLRELLVPSVLLVAEGPILEQETASASARIRYLLVFSDLVISTHKHRVCVAVLSVSTSTALSCLGN